MIIKIQSINSEVQKLFLLLIFTFGLLNAHAALAGPSDNVSGWAWAGPGIGWVSFNCTDQGTCGTVNYGVTITNGNFSGYAWSPGLGWLSFNRSETGNPPSNDPGSGSGAIAQVNSGGIVLGWARFLSTGGGWDGWIRLDHGQTNPVTLANGSPSVFHGYAWMGSNLTGGTSLVGSWVSFNCTEGGSGATNVCGTSDYNVITTYSLNQPPTASGLTVGTTNACGADGLTSDTTFSWTFSDPDPGDTQGAYDVQVCTTSVCTTVVQDSGLVSSASTIWNTTIANGTYFWRLKVQDNRGAQSNWINGPSSFTLPWPNINVNFTWNPSNPLPDTPITYTDASVCAPSPCTSWNWTFAPDGAPPTSTLQNPIITYSSSGTKTTTLTVGNGSVTCGPLNKTSSIGGVPLWRRFYPF